MIDNPMQKKNQLLDQHAKGQITLDELNKECAYWFLDCFSEIHIKGEPSAPRDYSDYKALDFKTRQKMSSEFYQREDIKGFLDLKDKIKNENESMIYKLKEFEGYIPEGDVVAHGKFREKISEFEHKDFY